MTRIALIHALSHSVAPINEAFARDWPEAVRMNLLDDSLSADLARNGRGLDAAMHERFQRLAQLDAAGELRETFESAGQRTGRPGAEAQQRRAVGEQGEGSYDEEVSPVHFHRGYLRSGRVRRVGQHGRRGQRDASVATGGAALAVWGAMLVASSGSATSR